MTLGCALFSSFSLPLSCINRSLVHPSLFPVVFERKGTTTAKVWQQTMSKLPLRNLFLLYFNPEKKKTKTATKRKKNYFPTFSSATDYVHLPLCYFNMNMAREWLPTIKHLGLFMQVNLFYGTIALQISTTKLH